MTAADSTTTARETPRSPRGTVTDRRLLASAAVVGMALVLALQSLAVTRQSLTGDEAHHLLAGHQALRYGANLLNWEHPPLPKLVGAGPTLLEAPLAPPLRVEELLPNLGSVYRDSARRERLTVAGRASMLVVFGLPLLVACGVLGHRFGGPWAGLLLALMLGLAYPVVPFLAMVLTDAPFALAALLTVLAAGDFATRPSLPRALATGLALGLAMVSKLTAVLLLPTLAAALAYAAMVPRQGRWRRLVAESGAAALAAAAVLWTVYAAANRAADDEALRATAAAYCAGRGTLVVGEHLRPAEAWLTDLTVAAPAAGQWLVGLLGVRAQSAIGVYQCYAFGRVDARGFRWYFPAVAAIKTPLPLLIAAVVAAIAGGWRRPRPGAWLSRPGVVLVAVTVGVYLTAAVGSTYNIGGVRHLLPVVPMLLLPLALWLARRPRLGLLVVTVLAVESFMLAPSWIAATNTWWLGDRNPTRFALSHGDLEYRQGFKELAAAARRRGVQDLGVLYPGLQEEALTSYLPDARLVGPGEATPPGWYAVSVLVEQFVPAIRHAEPAALGDERGLRRLARAYLPLWRRVRRGEDHGWIGDTFHLYRVRGRAAPTTPAADGGPPTRR
jgi:hypothetical protein